MGISGISMNHKGGDPTKTMYRFVGAVCDLPMSNASDRDFLLLLQHAALLGLKDAGCLTHMQYRQAEAALRQQLGMNTRMVHD